MRAVFDVRVGNVDDPKDAELVKNASPLHSASRIIRPLLIGQGANDPRVKQAESEQIVEAIQKNHGHVTYVVFLMKAMVLHGPKTARISTLVPRHSSASTWADVWNHFLETKSQARQGSLG